MCDELFFTCCFCFDLQLFDYDVSMWESLYTSYLWLSNIYPVLSLSIEIFIEFGKFKVITFSKFVDFSTISNLLLSLSPL